MNTPITVEAAPATEPLSPARRRPPPLALVFAAFAALYLIWGSTYLGITLAIETIPPFLMAGGRFVIAGAFLYGVMRWRGTPRPTARHWIGATAIGALLVLAGNGGVSWAQQRVPTGISALIVAAVPLWILLGDWMRPGGKRPTWVMALGLAVGFAGVVLIMAGRNALGERMVDPVGGAVLVLSSICWAAGSIYSRHAARPESALLTVSMQMFAGGCLQVLTGLLLGEGAALDLGGISASSMWAFIYLTVIGSLVGYSAYIWLLEVSTPAKVSTYAYVNPFVAVLLGSLFLKEPVPGTMAVAGALILSAVILLSRPSLR